MVSPASPTGRTLSREALFVKQSIIGKLSGSNVSVPGMSSGHWLGLFTSFSGRSGGSNHGESIKNRMDTRCTLCTLYRSKERRTGDHHSGMNGSCNLTFRDELEQLWDSAHLSVSGP